MAIDFPENPVIGDKHVDDEKVVWEYDGTQWDSISVDSITELNDLIDYDDTTPTIDYHIGFNNTTKLWESRPLVIQDVFIRLGMSVDFDIDETPPFFFDTVDYDYNNSGAYNTSTGVFTAPYAGWYIVDCGFYLNPNPSAYWIVYLQKNGVDQHIIVENQRYSFEATNYISACISTAQIIYCNYKDTLSLRDGGGSVNSNNAWLDSSICYGQITLIQ